jgi:CDP-glucose 4,6-dehydratase
MKQPFWQDRNVLITGATGFVGTYLTDRLLLEGANVVTIMRDFLPLSPFIDSNVHLDVTVVRGDLSNRELVERVISDYEIDSVFH